MGGILKEPSVKYTTGKKNGIKIPTLGLPPLKTVPTPTTGLNHSLTKREERLEVGKSLKP